LVDADDKYFCSDVKLQTVERTRETNSLPLPGRKVDDDASLQVDPVMMVSTPFFQN